MNMKRAAIARIQAVRLGPLDPDSAGGRRHLTPREAEAVWDAIETEARARLNEAEEFKEQYHEQWMLTARELEAAEARLRRLQDLAINIEREIELRNDECEARSDCGPCWQGETVQRFRHALLGDGGAV